MTGGPSPLQHASGLMRAARWILDEAGEAVSAAHLQTALDALAGVEPVEPDEALLRQAAIAADPVIVRAISSALAVICTVMERQGETSVKEIADILGFYAVVTDEMASDEGLVLGYWASVLRDAAQVRNSRDIELQGKSSET